jgi:hypothetical protein
MSRTIRTLVLVLGFAVLAASSAFAQPRAGQPAPAPAGSLAAVWEWLASLLVPASPVANAPGARSLEKAGSRMDPDGLSYTSTIYSGPTTEAGSQMDPNGEE